MVPIEHMSSANTLDALTISCKVFYILEIFQHIMATGKKDLEKLRKTYRDELAVLEEKCKAGNASKDEYAQLNKLRKKMK